MSEKEWLERATTFNMGICPHYNRPVEIIRRGQIDGSFLWIVKMQEWVLGKDGEFYCEPMPSSRSELFISTTRYTSPEEAYKTWREKVVSAKRLFLDGTKEFEEVKR